MSHYLGPGCSDVLLLKHGWFRVFRSADVSRNANFSRLSRIHIPVPLPVSGWSPSPHRNSSRTWPTMRCSIARRGRIMRLHPEVAAAAAAATTIERTTRTKSRPRTASTPWQWRTSRQHSTTTELRWRRRTTSCKQPFAVYLREENKIHYPNHVHTIAFQEVLENCSK